MLICHGLKKCVNNVVDIISDVLQSERLSMKKTVFNLNQAFCHSMEKWFLSYIKGWIRISYVIVNGGYLEKIISYLADPFHFISLSFTDFTGLLICTISAFYPLQ